MAAVVAAAEVYVSVKRDLFIWQKRPVNMSIPEVRASVKRGLRTWQKRPADEQKRPVHVLAYLTADDWKAAGLDIFVCLSGWLPPI